MRTRIAQTLMKFAGGRIGLAIQLHDDKTAPMNHFTLDDPENHQLVEPVRAIGYYESSAGILEADDVLVWVYRNRVVVVEPPWEMSLEEILLTIKHVVLSQELVFAEMRSDIERFNRLKEAAGASREPIPADVRAFVWRRDQGRCVRCDNTEKLEYDHIIPLAKGGSNTERNIQLLCESCNRSKGTTI
jgi:HNH endonuclease